MTNKLRRAILLTVILLVAGGAIALFVTAGGSGAPATGAKEYVSAQHAADTAAGNAVTSVYLNYRYWDTLFESLILLVSALAVISLSWSDTAPAAAAAEDEQTMLPGVDMASSPVVHTTAKVLIPFIIVFGLYIIISGADSAGGGFQGGAILSSAFIVRWIIDPGDKMDIRYMKGAERIFLLALVLTGMLLLGQNMAMAWLPGRVWMIAINLLIGVKVACGLTIIFYRFVFFEGR